MTNLMPLAARRWITRSRVLVGLPACFGLLVSVSVGLVFVRPAWKGMQELGQRRDSLLELQRNLPAVEAQLENEVAALEQAQQQQDVLLSLLAGREKVQTFLALLNQQALLAGVSIQRYQPIKPPPLPSAAQQGRAQSRSGKSDEQPEPVDPLSALGFQKSSVAFAVSGSYSGLQDFLQRMESLELLVQSSDLELRAGPDSDSMESITELTLKLSFYDKKDESPSEPSQSVATPTS